MEKEVYENLITNKLNPLKFYSDFESGVYQESYAAMVQIEALAEEPSEIYDETGNRILVYPTEINSESLDNVFACDSSFTLFLFLSLKSKAHKPKSKPIAPNK